jgi:cytochrome c553
VKRLAVAVGSLLSALLPALATAGDLARGKSKAESACQTCHGVDGQATVPMTPNLSGQQKDYLIIQMKAYRDGTRQHPQMSIVAQTLSDEDIEDVAEWYSSIDVTIEIPM